MTGFTHVRLATAFASLLLPAAAWAQPGMGPGMGPGGPPERKEKKEGPAEEAPKDKQALRPIEPVPAQAPNERRLQLFELHGYLRMRGDYFHRLDLGLVPLHPSQPGFKYDQFFRPPAETGQTDITGDFEVNDANCVTRLSTQGVPGDKIANRCRRRNGFASANLRLRLDPTIHVTDTVKIHARADVLDNLVLGSTPDGYGYDHPWAPIDLYTRTQLPPSSGINSFTDSVQVKSAWGEIRFGFGLNLRFGRMPRHWGLGIVYNDGNGYYRGTQDDIVRMTDTDYGDYVDSLWLGFDFGKDRRSTHTVAFSWDWASSGATTARVLGPEWDSGGRVGQDFSVEKFDNVYQWSLSLERRDQPDMLRRKLSLDRPVFNYGILAMLRYQDVDRAIGAPGLGSGLGTHPDYYDDAPSPDPLQGGGDPLANGDLDDEDDSGLNNFANMLVHRRAILFTPDVWMRVNWRTLRIELEAAANVGRFHRRDLTDDPVDAGGSEYFEDLRAVDVDERTFIANFGYAFEFKLGFFQDRFHIGFDQGFAMGDGTPPIDGTYQSPFTCDRDSNGACVSNDGQFNTFRFNPAYAQDLLLFREVNGTTANAAYFKPWAAFYFFDSNFSARADVMYAMAAERSATMGNRWSYGVELDGAVRYHDRQEPIFVQLQYGVLFPLPAFNRINDASTGLPSREDAKAAQTVQAQVGIRF